MDKIQIKIDFNDPSTYRGIVWLFGSMAALLAAAIGHEDRSAAIMGITGAAAGALGALTTKAEGKDG
jgi:VIT1/CCC1 family predicted Fe2+/Mn2+ transporter